MKMPTDTDLISKVRDVLEACARERKTITFGEIENRVGEKIAAWKRCWTPFMRTVSLMDFPT